MSDGSIAFFDSGLGGVPYLLEARRRAPGHAYTYYADTAHFPYGDQPVRALRRIVVDSVSRLIELVHPRVVVVACNTASVVGLGELRARFPVAFVGVVPAIKPAAERAVRIGVLATTRTVRDRYVRGLIRRFAAKKPVTLVAAGGLVRVIEEQLGSLDEQYVRDILREPMARFVEAGVTTIVLGCTHFVHVRDIIRDMAGEHVGVIDSVDGVVRRTLDLAGSPPGEAPGTTRLLVSDTRRAGSGYAYLVRAHGFEPDHLHASYHTHR